LPHAASADRQRTAVAVVNEARTVQCFGISAHLESEWGTKNPASMGCRGGKRECWATLKVAPGALTRTPCDTSFGEWRTPRFALIAPIGRRRSVGHRCSRSW